jgi:O-antigen ligase
MAEALGIQIPLITTVITVALAWFCVTRLRSRAKQIYGPLGLLFACGISFVLVQIAILGEPILSDTNRAFINWIVFLVVVQSLSVRQGFLHRLTLFLFLLGVIVVPHLSFQAQGYERARIDISVAGHLSNPIGLAEWFGFCSVYFAIYGAENKRGVIRVGSWLIAVGCLFVIGLTVSRGPILACALAITVGFRRFLSRGFVPLLLLIILTGVVYESGLFDPIASVYGERGTEDTGREVLWPQVIERILASPFFGVGASNVATFVPERGDSIASPHNSFLYFALSSGIVPLTFYVVFWLKTAWRNFSNIKRSEDDAFRLPLLIFTFVTVMLGDTGFMSPWALPALSFAAGTYISHGPRTRGLIRGSGRARILQTIGRRRKPTNSFAHS